MALILKLLADAEKPCEEKKEEQVVLAKSHLCNNPHCITSVEQELNHVFKLTDRENGIYRCIYCESKAK